MKVTYYPGCSLEGTARDYAESILGICASLDIQLEEIPDWNCCGATAAHSIDHLAGIELAGRTLNLAAKLPHPDMLVPCPMCFNRLKTAAWTLNQDSAQRYGIHLEASLPKVWDLANFLASDPMLKTIAQNISKPLEGLKVVSYYGCMANRPPEITEATDFENPQALDRIIQNLGGCAISWPYKTDCCGASQVFSRRDIVSRLVGKLYEMAQRVGAQAIVVSCQMCQANLDMHQEAIGADWGKQFSFPIYYFTELIGLAHNVAGVEKWLSRHITDPFSLLRQLNLWNRS
ncbi:MAG: heterodisulfide reductase-related iron-sulfur binding cluster [Desulfobacterales bacterium]|nr:heterodisulfide reductase-related iron-sulfur binding cluster [Desulfobacterales bacterium]